MSQYIAQNWPIIDVKAVCALQSITVISGSGSLNLNGTLASTFTPGQISFIRSGFSRSVSLTSVNNLSAVNFTITGLQNSAVITETIAGPNNNTVFTYNAFDTISSVSVNGSVSNVSVGTGNTGFLPLIQVNVVSNSLSVNYPNYALSAIVPAVPGITYALWSTLEAVDNNGIALIEQVGRFFSILSGETSNQLYQSVNLTNYLLLNITASTMPLTDNLSLIYVQS